MRCCVAVSCIGVAQTSLRVPDLSALATCRAADPVQSTKLVKTRDNVYALLIAKEQERAKLVTVYAGLYKASLEGEKPKIEAIKEMQAIQSTAFNLKEKRAALYWTMRNGRNEKMMPNGLPTQLLVCNGDSLFQASHPI